MPITVICDVCAASVRVRDDAAGRRFRCKGCGKVLVVRADDEWDGFESGDEYDSAPQARRTAQKNRRPRGRLLNCANSECPLLLAFCLQSIALQSRFA